MKPQYCINMQVGSSLKRCDADSRKIDATGHRTNLETHTVFFHFFDTCWVEKPKYNIDPCMFDLPFLKRKKISRFRKKKSKPDVDYRHDIADCTHFY